jgi:hypothetical protein
VVVTSLPSSETTETTAARAYEKDNRLLKHFSNDFFYQRQNENITTTAGVGVVAFSGSQRLTCLH